MIVAIQVSELHSYANHYDSKAFIQAQNATQNSFTAYGHFSFMLVRSNRNKQALYRWLHHCSMLVVVIGILLPSLGSWLGLNVAAIQPNHAHIYFGANHQHHHDLFLEAILPHPHPEEVAADAVVSVSSVDVFSSVYSVYLLLFAVGSAFGYHEIFSGRLEHEKGFVHLFNFSPPYPPPR